MRFTPIEELKRAAPGQRWWVVLWIGVSLVAGLASDLRAQDDDFKPGWEKVRVLPGLSAEERAGADFLAGFLDIVRFSILEEPMRKRLLRYAADHRDGNPALVSDAFAEPNSLFRGRMDGAGAVFFDELKPPGGVARALVYTSRALAVGDVDGDGGLDLLIVDGAGETDRSSAVSASIRRTSIGDPVTESGGTWRGGVPSNASHASALETDNVVSSSV